MALCSSSAVTCNLKALPNDVTDRAQAVLRDASSYNIILRIVVNNCKNNSIMTGIKQMMTRIALSSIVVILLINILTGSASAAPQGK